MRFSTGLTGLSPLGPAPTGGAWLVGDEAAETFACYKSVLAGKPALLLGPDYILCGNFVFVPKQAGARQGYGVPTPSRSSSPIRLRGKRYRKKPPIR
jgi:hypothetical protein